MEASVLDGPSRAETLVWWGRMARDPLAAYAGLRRTYGDAVAVPFRRHRPLLLLSQPEHAECVLVSHQDNYVKSFTYRPLAAFLGSGLLTSEGTVWQRHRHLVGPVFAQRHLDGFAPAIAAAAERMDARWRRGPGVVDVGEQMRGLTLDVVGQVLFGTSLQGSVERIGSALGTVQRASMVGILLAGLAPERAGWAWLRQAPTVRRPANALDEIVSRIIATRRAAPVPEGPRDLLDLLLAARGDEGSALTDTEIHDEVLTLMVAGHETTSHALTWTLALLARHPTARERLQSEVDRVLGDRSATADDVDRLPFTQAVLNESMRLYPPAWTIERDAVDGDTLAGIPVAAGSTVVISPYLLHRHPQIWPDPERFDPERFLGEQDRPRRAFLPFGAGRRVCVGAGFAMFEATLLLASITRTHRLDLMHDAMPPTRAAITLRPRGPVAMQRTPRRHHRRSLNP